MKDKVLYSENQYNNRINRESVIGAYVGILGFLLFVYADIMILNYPMNITVFRLFVIGILFIYIVISKKVFNLSNGI